jgi:predicted dehydrogenase
VVEINAGLVGFGYWGQKLFREFTADPRFRISKVVVRHPKTLANALETSLLSSDLETILLDSAIQAVIVATPVKTHYEIGLQVLDAKKDLFMEKVLAATSSEADELKQLAEANGCRVLVDYTFSFSQALQEMKRLVDEQAIGSVKGAFLTMRQLGRFNSSDVFTLLGSHMLAVLDRFFPIQQLSFYRIDTLIRDGITESGAILFRENLETSTGFAGVIQISLNHPEREREVTLYGDSGTISCDLTGDSPLRLTQYSVDRDSSDRPHCLELKNYTEFHNEQGIQNSISAFYELLNGRRESNLATAVMINKILDSFMDGGQGQLPY